MHINRITLTLAATAWTIVTSAADVVAKPTASGALSCREALNIIGAAASSESNSGDILVASVPPFPDVAVLSATGVPELVRLTPESGWWLGNWEGARPSRSLIHRWFAAPYKSISICIGPNARRAVDRLPSWKEHRTKQTKLRYNVRVTYPVLDASGRHALIVYSTIAANWITGGNSQMILLERSAGKWRKVGSGFISVS